MRFSTLVKFAVSAVKTQAVLEVFVSPAEQSDGMVSYTAVRMNEPKI